MDEMQILGFMILGVITLGTFVGLVIKFTQPINELRVVIQKLNDKLDFLKNDSDKQNQRLDRHGEQIDELNQRVDKIETKVDLYHEKGL